MLIKTHRYKKLACFALLLISYISLAEQSEYHLSINTEIMVPYNFYGSNNEIIGINIEIIKNILKRTNISADFNLYPWVRSYQITLKTNNAGLMSTARTADREKQFKWVGPLASGEGYLYKLKSRKDISVSSLEDAKNYVVAVVHGDVYQKIFEDLGFKLNKNLIMFSYNAEYIKPFMAKKVDLILGSNIVLPYMLSAHNSNIGLLEPVAKMPNTGGNFLALNKNIPDDIVDKLNQALLELKASSEFNEIIHKYSKEQR